MEPEPPCDLVAVDGYGRATITFPNPKDLSKSPSLEFVPWESRGRFAEASVVSWNWAGGVRGFVSEDELRAWIKMKLTAHQFHRHPKQAVYAGGRNLE